MLQAVYLHFTNVLVIPCDGTNLQEREERKEEGRKKEKTNKNVAIHIGHRHILTVYKKERNRHREREETPVTFVKQHTTGHKRERQGEKMRIETWRWKWKK